jgi:hypothetical protein
MLRILDTIKTIERKKTDSRGLPIVQFVMIFTLTCMNDSVGSVPILKIVITSSCISVN